MELPRLIAALSEPSAYPGPVDRIEVRQTHISLVFLAGPHAYKVKKPVNLGFLDFTTLEKRRHFCEEEVRLNRRLAPAVYRGVVPIARAGAALRVEGDGEPVEWAVKMKRLPEQATFLERLRRREIDEGAVRALATRVAEFHAGAEASERISAFGGWKVVARNARENFEQAESQIGVTVSRPVFERLQALTEAALDRLAPLIKERAKRGVPRDTHGDLHLDHVYLFPDQTPPDDLVIIDCIEFNERFRYADPVADMAFLVMDLLFHAPSPYPLPCGGGEGRVRGRDLARAFAEQYFRASGDEQGRDLLPFYTAYRAAVRGKVEGFELLEREIPEAERIAALSNARTHWLLALGELDAPERRPCLVVAGGLPGTGKSTLARGLAEVAGFRLIRSDEVRKKLAGLPPRVPARSSVGEGIYSPKWTERTYAECLQRAEAALFEGERVLVDASFGEESMRRTFLDAAERLRLPGVFFLCWADPEAIRVRLDNRQGDASDADWSVYRRAEENWEGIGPLTRQVVREVSTRGTRKQALTQALDALREWNLLP